MLDVVLSGHAATGYVRTCDVTVMRGGASKMLPDEITVAQDYDCFGLSPHWELPAGLDVEIGKAGELQFRAGLNGGGYPPNAEVRVSDIEGWIVAPDPIDVEMVCGWCPWSGTLVAVPVVIPDGVADKTPDAVALEMYSFGVLVDTRTVTLRAVTAVAAEVNTWGRVKSLYR